MNLQLITATEKERLFLSSSGLQAHLQAQSDGFLGTDDASLLEHAGLPVYLSAGDRENLKLTTPTDLRLAELILAARAEQEDAP